MPGACDRRATPRGGMHRRPGWRSYFRTGPQPPTDGHRKGVNASVICGDQRSDARGTTRGAELG